MSARFKSDYNPIQLIRAVAAVALEASPDDPERVSQSQWDDARAQAGHPQAPRAKNVSKRFALPWGEVLRISFSSDPSFTLAHSGRASRLESPTEEEIVLALKVIAARIEAESLTPDQYAAERELLLKQNQRRHSYLRLPNVNQINSLAGSWDRALELSGLSEREDSQRRGYSVPEAIDLFIEANGMMPTHKLLEQWMKRHGVAFSRIGATSWGEHVKEARRQRKARGLSTPRKRATPTKNPVEDLSPPALGSGELPARRKRSFSEEDCRQAMRDFLAQLPPGARPTQAAYRAFSRGRPSAPWPSTFEKHGGWGAVRDQEL